MVGKIFLALFCAVFGTICNYYCVDLIKNALSLTNGTDAITQFLLGMTLWLVGCTSFACMTFAVEWIVDELKGE
jgi:hypothetical protein